jgi:hypothetical protein
MSNNSPVNPILAFANLSPEVQQTLLASMTKTGKKGSKPVPVGKSLPQEGTRFGHSVTYSGQYHKQPMIDVTYQFSSGKDGFIRMGAKKWSIILQNIDDIRKAVEAVK